MSDENRIPSPIPPEGAGDLVLYRTEDGRTRVSCRFEDGSVWLTQAAMADLFQTTPQNITLHVAAIYGEGELQEDATCKQSLQVRQEGSRKVGRHLRHYNLNMILAVGYRVRSPRGTQFRQWATARLEEYLVKGFTLDDERLKQVGGGNYFDELLARIRDIRSSERVFWRKVLDIYATSVDYDPRAEASQQFFKVVQHKMHWAAHGQTAAEVIARRAGAAKPNMGLTSWAGGRPRRTDAGVAKNYLTHAGGISHDVAIAKAQAACCRQTQNETAEANGIGADSPCHNSHSRTAAKQWCTAPRGKSWTKSPRRTPKARRCRGR